MKFNYNDYLEYRLPLNWCSQEDEDNLILYDPNGEGAMTISFLNILNTETFLDEQVSVLAKKFIDQNKIVLDSPLILFEMDDKSTMCGAGTTPDDWFIKLWIIAKYPKIVFATYQCKQKNKEIKACDSIVDSLRFL